MGVGDRSGVGGGQSGTVDGAVWVGHLDIDAFFAQASLLSRPHLAARPVAIGGDGPRAVVATANYAARRSGVRSAMPMWQAKRRCPQLVVLPPDFELYRDLSAQVMAAVAAVSDVYERVSIDETYFEPDPGGDIRAALTVLKAKILDSTGLTVSVGAASTRVAAKFASEHAKPDGLHVVDAVGEARFVQQHPVAALPGWGPATAAKAGRLDVVTVGDLLRVDFAVLAGVVGVSHAQHLVRLARNEPGGGLAFSQPRTSVNHEVTFDEDLVSVEVVREHTLTIAEAALGRLHAEHAAAATVAVKFRTADRVDQSRQVTLPHPSSSPSVLMAAVGDLLEVALGQLGGRPVRLIGVSFSGLGHSEQLGLFDAPAEFSTPKPLAPGTVVEHRLRGVGLVFDRYGDALVVRFSDRAVVVDASYCHPTGRTARRWSDVEL